MQLAIKLAVNILLITLREWYTDSDIILMGGCNKMSKRIWLGVVALSSAVLLSACGSQNATSQSTSQSTTSKPAQNPTKTKGTLANKTASSTKSTKTTGAMADVKLPQVAWDNQKQVALDRFMDNWGRSFSPAQVYDNFYPATKATSNYMGYKFPDDFSQNNIAVNNQHVSANVSPTGADKYDYNVVAIYSDYLTLQSRDVAHLYFMTLHHGQPVVLVTEQNEGMPDHLLHFTPTANQELINGFAKLVKEPSQPIHKQPELTYQGTKLDYRQIGVMAYKYANPDATPLVKYLGTNPLASLDVVNGKLHIGTRETEKAIEYSYDQHSVHLTWPDSGKTATVSVADLVKATYHTAAQQTDVNTTAQTMPLS